MGGYNNVCDVLSFEKRALVVPRAWPRCEQIIRALRLRDLGLIDVVLPQDVSADTLTRWFKQDRPSPFGFREQIDINGLNRLPLLTRQILDSLGPWPLHSRAAMKARIAS
jgi:predicted glycosyltransferase